MRIPPRSEPKKPAALARTEAVPLRQEAQAAPAPSAQAAPAKLGAEPQSTQASYGDWVVRCQKLETAPGRICEVAQVIQVEKQNAPIAQIALGRLKKGDPLRLTLLLPVNIALPSTVKLVVDGKDAEGIEVAWTRCLPSGCIADTAMADAALRKLRAVEAAGAIVVITGANQEMRIPMSFRGLTQALDALEKDS